MIKPERNRFINVQTQANDFVVSSGVVVAAVFVVVIVTKSRYYLPWMVIMRNTISIRSV